MEYKELKKFLPKFVTNLVDLQYIESRKDQTLYSFITAFSSLMPNVTVISTHLGESVNLSHIDINDYPDIDDIYLVRDLLSEVIKEINTRVITEDPSKKKLMPDFMLDGYYDEGILCENLKAMEDYGELLITNMPEDVLYLFRSKRSKYNYANLRMYMDNQLLCSPTTISRQFTIEYPRISIILSGIFEQIESLTKEPSQGNLARFLLTETTHTDCKVHLDWQRYDNLCSTLQEESGKVKDLFVTLYGKDITVFFTSDQANQLNEYYSSITRRCIKSQKDKCLVILEEYLHNLIKLGSVLATIRAYEENRIQEELTATDDDFQAAFAMIKKSINICLKYYNIHFVDRG